MIEEELAQAISEYWKVDNKVRMCMAGPDALEAARAKVAKFGDPSILLGGEDERR